MARYIDADRFEQERAYLRAHLTFPDGTSSLGYYAVLTSVQIKDAPTEDVAPVIHGHWVTSNGKFVALDDEGDTRHEAYCSVCGDWLTASDEYATRGKYCPNCGAKMDEVVQ